MGWAQLRAKSFNRLVLDLQKRTELHCELEEEVLGDLWGVTHS